MNKEWEKKPGEGRGWGGERREITVLCRPLPVLGERGEGAGRSWRGREGDSGSQAKRARDTGETESEGHRETETETDVPTGACALGTDSPRNADSNTEEKRGGQNKLKA